MKNLLPHITIIIMCLLLAGCADNDAMVNGQWSMANDPVGQPVLFSAGNLAEANTRALGSASPYYHGMSNTSGVPYMALNGRFVCTMYYHPKATDTDASEFDIKDNTDGGTMTTAWLKVNNNVGNSVYWNMYYHDVDPSGIDENYGFDKSATMFYWQNRLTHAFLALADYNKLSTNTAPADEEFATTPSPATAQGKLKLYPYWDKDFSALPVGVAPEDITQAQQDAYDDILSNNRYANKYDLTRKETRNEAGVITSYGVNTIYEQPDPILALTIMKPAGATQEANRVRLFFKHQFSQIQVNIKGADDSSAEITADQIEGVELLGVSTEGYVCNRLNADGTVGAASAKDVNLDEFSDAVLEDNKWGTSFQMFDMATEGHVEPAYDEYVTWEKPEEGTEPKYVQEDIDYYVVATDNTYYEKVGDNYNIITNINDYNSATAYKYVADSYEIFTDTPASGTTYYYFDDTNKEYKEIDDIDNYTGTKYIKIAAHYEPITFYKKIHHDAVPITGYATGYLKSFDAIAFGDLQAIRITWHEGTSENPGIKHVSTFEVPQENEEKVNLRQLASGMKYIYNLELRRGTLAVIRTEILPWDQDEELVYGTDGTIIN